jgi:hypothetical protein
MRAWPHHSIHNVIKLKLLEDRVEVRVFNLNATLSRSNALKNDGVIKGIPNGFPCRIASSLHGYYPIKWRVLL